MSAQQLLHDALLAALSAAPAVGGALNGVYAGPPAKATTPYAELGDMIMTDWSTKDAAGRELVSAVIIRDRAETPVRAQLLADATDTVVQGLPRVLGAWRIASLVLVRSRVLRTNAGGWTAIIEHRVRMLHQGSQEA